MAKVLISMREEFLDKIDTLADMEQRTRSELIRQALRVYLKRKKQHGDPKRLVNRTELLESILFEG